ncbi:MAG: magnesium transporter [Chromatiaceae bacterium]|nr:magnesium transporter [Gammaproteobacteria bacterium]MCB1881372.1 magnesium transporter [Gammaproteobacteria bacterium]MCB1904029.1 magnesium transporter [Gammaproteobacteria bacterium]MCP5448206.1 magnesium transporter [Chromatiaceae bacterium]
MFIDTSASHSSHPAGNTGAKLRKLAETVERLYSRNARRSLEKIISKVYPADIASVLSIIPEEHVAAIFHAIPDTTFATDVLTQVNDRVQRRILAETPDSQLITVLEKLPPDKRTLLIRELEPERAELLLSELEKVSQKEVEALLKHAPDTAGGIMTTDFFDLTEETTVDEAIRAVREHAEVEMVYYLYVTGTDHKLMGVISIRQLLLAKPKTPLREVMNSRIISVTTDADREIVAQLVDKYRLLAIPVVDASGCLVGMVTVDDVFDVLESETTEDMLRMAGTDKSEILTHSAFRVAWIRLPWLLAAFIGGLAATGIIRLFEGVLMEVIALGAFLPVIMGMAGNVGVQTATVTVRGLATGSLDLRDVWSVLQKELRVGLMLGLIYGAGLGIYGWFMFGDLSLAGVVSLTIFGNMTGAALLAVALPMLFQRIGTDPAIATGPFVTTAIDVFGVLNYFLIASALLDLSGA